MLKVKLPIYYHTDESSLLDDLGIEQEDSFEKMEVREMIFYNINAIAKYIENEKEVACRIFSNGDAFLCKLLFEEVEKIIDHANS